METRFRDLVGQVDRETRIIGLANLEKSGGGGNGSSGYGAGGGGGFFGGGGGGYTNGTYGGAGAGSSFVEDTAMNVVMLGGEGIQPGSVGVKGREPPLAALGEEFNVKEGFFAGQGGEADVQTVHIGCSGAVRIIQKKYSRWFM